MSIELLMPKAGLTNTEGTICVWHAKEGSTVKKGDVIAEVETEKSTLDFQSPGDGILHIMEAVGTEVTIGGIMGYLASNKAEYDNLFKGGTPAEGVSTAASVVGPTVQPAASAGTHSSKGITFPQRVYATPLARKIAKDAGVDIAQVSGTGPCRRIVRKDVEGYLCSLTSLSTRGAAHVAATADRQPVHTPLSGTRKTIAKRMYASLQSMAQTSDMVEVDVTELVRLRNKLAAKEENLGTRITYTDLFSFAAIKMLRDHPLANASFNDTEIISYPNVNLSIAVATDYGLTSPVVPDADLMSLTELSQTLKDVISRARSNQLRADELTGGTFTITNMGLFEVDMFSPIINPPQSAILGFGRMVKKPVVFEGEITVRSMMYMSITYDHRVFDGSYVGGIMGHMKDFIENPELFLV